MIIDADVEPSPALAQDQSVARPAPGIGDPKAVNPNTGLAELAGQAALEAVATDEGVQHSAGFVICGDE
ncbi:hypothetical protein [Oricola sp.]|uniref:hypothetical protein n=1 Tax=Oricola sp. TaxID=1979950 RepID=UPI00260133A4|nr:hypothetical protein [Oricola sp.]MCI5073606.1 hypothetical protein [Oricola sp.]